jgi:hypothetical protein
MHLQDLVTVYQTKSDDELIALASEPAHLTPEALAVLHGELATRRIELGNWPQADDQHPSDGIAPQRTPSATGLPSVAQFLTEVLSIFHTNFWLYFRLIAPAVIIGYVAIFMARREVREIARHLTHQSEFFEILFVNLAGYFGSWLAFCVSFAGICVATARIVAGSVPSVFEAFSGIRGRINSFFRLAILLFVLALLAVGAAMLLETSIWWVSRQRHFRLSLQALYVLSFACGSLAMLVLSRFALAMPAVVLDNRPVKEAMFRSDELTEGKWSILAALLAKSLVGGYIAAMCPFWLASWLAGYVVIAGHARWLLHVASIGCVATIEPVMFVGFALLYLRAPDSTAVDKCVRPPLKTTGEMKPSSF